VPNHVLILQVTGLQALKTFSRHFIVPYQPTLKKGTIEAAEKRIAALKQMLRDAEEELERLRKGKQIA